MSDVEVSKQIKTTTSMSFNHVNLLILADFVRRGVRHRNFHLVLTPSRAHSPGDLVACVLSSFCTSEKTCKNL